MRPLLAFAVLAVPSAGAAEPRRVAVDTPVEAFTAHPAAVPPVATVLFVNRCSGGCAITGGAVHDAKSHISTIPPMGSYTIAEFKNSTGQTGTAADEEWNAILACLKDVYSPYDVTVTDQLPAADTPYNEAIVAGLPGNVGLGDDILGIAPLANDCSAQSNVISFSFANYHGTQDRVNNICWTAAQESGHAYGLDHQYVFTDGESACSDPTTYRMDCGGRKFFRNRFAQCGESAVRKCRCTPSQNSHQKLLSVFGQGTPTTPPPTVTLSAPLDGATVGGSWSVHAEAGSERGVAKVELFLNGSRWVVLPGAKFGSRGQVNPGAYAFAVPTNVPDGIIDVTVKAYDDLGIMTATPMITVTKGAPCSIDSQCLEYQTCNAGRCEFPPPAAELGDSCEYDQACTSWSCIEVNNGEKRCTTECRTDDKTTCPTDFSCLPTANGAGVCWPTDDGGCCSSTHNNSPTWFQLGLLGLVIGALRRKRGR